MKDRQRTALIVIIIVCVMIFAAAGGYLVLNKIQQNKTDSLSDSYASDLIQDTTTVQSTEITAPENIDVVLAENPINFDGLHETNSEIYSWIYIPNTNINYPVAQSTVDDNFYLNHDVYKNYDFPGTIYSQSCNSLDYTDRVTVLYGHNMLNGSMFADLHKFEDESFFNDNRYIYIYTDNRKLTYEVVSAFVYDDRHIMNSFDFSDDKVFLDYLEAALNPHSIYRNVRSGIDLDLNSKLLVLSTCLNSGEGRYLVQGVLINDERTN